MNKIICALLATAISISSFAQESRVDGAMSDTQATRAAKRAELIRSIDTMMAQTKKLDNEIDKAGKQAQNRGHNGIIIGAGILVGFTAAAYLLREANIEMNKVVPTVEKGYYYIRGEFYPATEYGTTFVGSSKKVAALIGGAMVSSVGSIGGSTEYVSLTDEAANKLRAKLKLTEEQLDQAKKQLVLMDAQ